MECNESMITTPWRGRAESQLTVAAAGSWLVPFVSTQLLALLGLLIQLVWVESICRIRYMTQTLGIPNSF